MSLTISGPVSPVPKLPFPAFHILNGSVSGSFSRRGLGLRPTSTISDLEMTEYSFPRFLRLPPELRGYI